MQTWIAYRERHGPLDAGRRNEWLMARLSAQLYNLVNTEKKDIEDFMRFGEEEDASIDDVAKLMGVKGTR